MNEHTRVSDLPNGDRDLAGRFPVLHEQFGPEVLRSLTKVRRPIVLSSLDAIAKHNPDFVEEVVRLILERREILKDRKPG